MCLYASSSVDCDIHLLGDRGGRTGRISGLKGGTGKKKSYRVYSERAKASLIELTKAHQSIFPEGS